jgi:hypothetical protein
MRQEKRRQNVDVQPKIFWTGRVGDHRALYIRRTALSIRKMWWMRNESLHCGD